MWPSRRCYRGTYLFETELSNSRKPPPQDGPARDCRGRTGLGGVACAPPPRPFLPVTSWSGASPGQRTGQTGSEQAALRGGPFPSAPRP